MAMDRDHELMLRVREGDADSLDELLRLYRRPLAGYFARMVRDPALAEDLVQETFLRIFKSRHRYRPDARFATYLYRVATNLALNAIRDRRDVWLATKDGEDGEARAVESRLPDGHPTAEQQMIEAERQRQIREAVETLPPNQRAAVLLHKYQDADYRQIAEILGVSESAVKSLLFRAYEALRARLAPLVKGSEP
jgi:RNA polymerase sigma-70 factor (ECF subfamily)